MVVDEHHPDRPTLLCHSSPLARNACARSAAPGQQSPASVPGALLAHTAPISSSAPATRPGFDGQASAKLLGALPHAGQPHAPASHGSHVEALAIVPHLEAQAVGLEIEADS